jgi:predicted Holliday junction resolvase-like endonuclease
MRAVMAHDSSLLGFLLALAVVALVVLAFKNLALQARVHERVQAQVAAWKERELESVQARLWQAAQAEARGALERWRVETEAEIRADAVRRSSAVVSGKVTEHLAPYMDGFPYDPRDARFLGTPVDLIVFDGLGDDALREIVFLEIKSGSSSLTTRERRVRDAVIARRVAWKEFRVGGD